MRKYIIGAIFGILLGTSISAHAEVASIVGKVIEGDFTVIINGRTLNNKAIVIEGTSYLPVREIGDSIGYNVSFDQNIGIKLSPKFDNTGLQTKYLPMVKINDNTEMYNGDFYYLESDGNQYASINCLIGPYSLYWTGRDTGVFHPVNNGKSSVQISDVYIKRADDVTVKLTNDYVKDSEAFRYKEISGMVFVKLSTLGLKAEVKYNEEIKDDELIITKNK
ncbi:hypothetical protein P5G65_11955 [Paenibacillus chondroitinus]|uniref:Copper amine oxidase-like N-terminal domain-containing protein n=1 Tax=Paenibacillus chondroitinus TaxID=59842 RepID=A0ABU6DCK0_9BACL|nr:MULTISPECIES: hypothetical protein [Paenibacillus]MCY9662344.1 copper amine oxidase N-terminal domain-containing protein [Paenibacillus anseongense]MEB4794616.1 hypothetical protein [Paenibacillus chondroitinus]